MGLLHHLHAVNDHDALIAFVNNDTGCVAADTVLHWLYRSYIFDTSSNILECVAREAVVSVSCNSSSFCYTNKFIR